MSAGVTMNAARQRFRISCLTCIIFSGSMAAEDISGVDVAIAGGDIAGWAVTLCDPSSGEGRALGRHAGLPGVLRRLREALAPDAPAGRLVIGAQQILGRDAGAR